MVQWNWFQGQRQEDVWHNEKKPLFRLYVFPASLLVLAFTQTWVLVYQLLQKKWRLYDQIFLDRNKIYITKPMQQKHLQSMHLTLEILWHTELQHILLAVWRLDSVEKEPNINLACCPYSLRTECSIMLLKTSACDHIFPRSSIKSD